MNDKSCIEQVLSKRIFERTAKNEKNYKKVLTEYLCVVIILIYLLGK